MSLRLDPENEEYKAILADLLARDGQAAEASKIFSTFSIKDDTNPMVLKMLALQKIRITDPQSARTLLERFAQREDTKSDSWFQVLRARAWLRSGFNKHSAPLFQNAADLTQSELLQTTMASNRCHFEFRKRHGKSEDTQAPQSRRRNPAADPVWQASMSAELAHSDLNASRKHLFAALASKRCYSRALVANVTYLQSHGYFEHAKKCLDYYEQLRPTSSELHFSEPALQELRAGRLKHKESTSVVLNSIRIRVKTTSNWQTFTVI